MGACDISFTLKNKASQAEVEKAFSKQQMHDSFNSEGDDAYTGDFQTVNKVDYRLSLPAFEDQNKAMDYCLDHAEKWESVIAVYFKNDKGEIYTLVAGWGAC